MNVLIEKLNAYTKEDRLRALADLKALIDSGDIKTPQRQVYTNNHVHTKYSFSPYSPAKAVWSAYMSGLSTVGIIDHDAVGGAQEFIQAGEILGIATTVGFEIRTDWSDTQLAGKRINNPDQVSNAYISAHGIPHQNIRNAHMFLRKIRTARAMRNEKIVDNINGIVDKLGISVDYDQDVLPLSMAHDGGGVTERHLLFALTKKIIAKYGKGEALIDVLRKELNIALGVKPLAYLLDKSNAMYEYDLLNVLKSSFIADIYVNADRSEAIPVQQAVDFIKELGAIPTYCYLGDVEASPTGDKKAQKFEDDYLEDVFEVCKRIGFWAIAYMPSRNTKKQLARVMALCDKYEFMQISGEDINQPRQSFVCEQLTEYKHLTDTTWALVGHELSATKNIRDGMFAADVVSLQQRIEKYKLIGMKYGGRK